MHVDGVGKEQFNEASRQSFHLLIDAFEAPPELESLPEEDKLKSL